MTKKPSKTDLKYSSPRSTIIPQLKTQLKTLLKTHLKPQLKFKLVN